MRTKKKRGVFEIEYELITKVDNDVNSDIQFGMDFTLKNTSGSNKPKHLCQVIFPATGVGTNIAGQWNIDNHRDGNDALSLVFANAENGQIIDTPRELSHKNEGYKNTVFHVYIVNVDKSVVYSKGVSFGYSINTNDKSPKTVFIDLKQVSMGGEQKRLLENKCSYIKFE